MGLAADFGGGVVTRARSTSSSARVARLTLVNPPLNLVTRELLEAFEAALDDAARPPRPATSGPSS